MLTLYTTPLSANGRKPLALAYELGLDIEVHEVNVYQGEGQSSDFLALSPAGKVPVLDDDGFVLAESNAILQYLSEVHGGHGFSSTDSQARARISSWLFWEAAHWQPTLTRVLAAHVGHALRPDVLPAPPTPPDWAEVELVSQLRRLEGRLSDCGFLAGEDLTTADLSVAGMMTYFGACEFPFDAWPQISGWYRGIEALEGWTRSRSELWG